MKYSERGLPQVIDRVYAACLHEEPWPAALGAVCSHFGAFGGWVFELDRNAGEITNWIPYRIERTAGEWVEHIKSIDPRMTHTFTHPAGVVDFDAQFISEREMDRHEFYDWQLKGAGTRHFLGSRFRDGATHSSFVAITFAASRGGPSRAAIRSFGLLARHVDNAWRLWNRLDANAPDAGLPAFISERIPWGVVTAGADGRVIAMNSRAERMLELQDGLAVVEGRLIALRSDENRTLQALIAEILQAAAGASLHSGGSIRVARESGLPGYVLQVLPYIGAAGRNIPAAVVYIADPAALHDLDPDTLISAFGLTGREAALAALLANGTTLAQAADRLQISYNTARIHLQSVFRKTGTSNQSALVRLLAQLIGREGSPKS